MEGSQIIFTGLGFRYDYKSEKLKLQNMDLVDIVSISPRDDFFKPVFWKAWTGLGQKLGVDHLVYDLSTGAGFAGKIPLLGLFYVFGETEAYLGGNSEERWAVGAGASAGVIRSLGEQLKVHFFGRDIDDGLGDRHNDLELSFQANFAYGTNGSLSAGVTWKMACSVRDTEGTLSWNLFFWPSVFSNKEGSPGRLPLVCCFPKFLPYPVFLRKPAIPSSPRPRSSSVKGSGT